MRCIDFALICPVTILNFLGRDFSPPSASVGLYYSFAPKSSFGQVCVNVICYTNLIQAPTCLTLILSKSMIDVKIRAELNLRLQDPAEYPIGRHYVAIQTRTLAISKSGHMNRLCAYWAVCASTT